MNTLAYHFTNWLSRQGKPLNTVLILGSVYAAFRFAGGPL